jgi:putative peptide zinc metalloprotease protein
LLGIFLMAVELGWFIARPMVNELRVRRRRVPATGWTRRNVVTALVALALIAFVVTPWGAASPPLPCCAPHARRRYSPPRPDS